jgi:hypothetical protein
MVDPQLASETGVSNYTDISLDFSLRKSATGHLKPTYGS